MQRLHWWRTSGWQVRQDHCHEQDCVRIQQISVSAPTSSAPPSQHPARAASSQSARRAKRSAITTAAGLVNTYLHTVHKEGGERRALHLHNRLLLSTLRSATLSNEGRDIMRTATQPAVLTWNMMWIFVVLGCIGQSLSRVRCLDEAGGT